MNGFRRLLFSRTERKHSGPFAGSGLFRSARTADDRDGGVRRAPPACVRIHGDLRGHRARQRRLVRGRRDDDDPLPVYRGLDELTYRFTTRRLPSPTVPDLFQTARSTWVTCLRDRTWGSPSSASASGSSPSWSTTWAISTMRRAASNDRQSLRTERVTYVLGINCDPCVRNRPRGIGSSGWIRTSNPPVNRRKKKR